MIKTQVKTISIDTLHDKPQSKGQKSFNKLIKQIEVMRTQLSAWEAALPSYQKKYVNKFIPLVKTSVSLQIKMVYCLDRSCDKKGLTKTERSTISGLITDFAGQLLAENDSAELKVVYNKHSKFDYDSEDDAAMQGAKTMLEIDFEEDLGNLSAEELLLRAQAQMHEEWAQEVARLQAQEERRAKRKKSAKQLAKEVQQEAEDYQVSQSIRDVYRKLASVLHPDREIDPQERERKTALMQRVNQAYGKNNLLQLLELQLELEHIDQSDINNISEDRLKHYNKILKGQLSELQQEIYHVEDGFRAQFGISPFAQVSPNTIMRNLARDIASLTSGIYELKKDLLAFEDIKNIKSWLKSMRSRSKMGYADDRC
jgi:hypothetical protein